MIPSVFGSSCSVKPTGVLSGYYFCAVLREGIHSVGPVHCARGAHPAAVPGLFPGEWFFSQPSVTYENWFVVF